MKRFLQIDAGVATAELYTEQIPTVLPPGRSFVDVTDRPVAVLGGFYDTRTDSFTQPTPTRPVDMDDMPLTPREHRNLLRTILKTNTDRV